MSLPTWFWPTVTPTVATASTGVRIDPCTCFPSAHSSTSSPFCPVHPPVIR